MALPLVGTAVADLRGARQALRAVDVHDVLADLVAVAVAAPGAGRALGGARPADAGSSALRPVDTLVGASETALEGHVCVLPDLARDGASRSPRAS